MLEKLLARGVRNTNGCFEWTGARSTRGYGNVRINNFLHNVHRLTFSLINGPIPKGIVICHRCDNPSCFEITHLFADTHKGNMADMKAKGRSPRSRGEKCGKAKLKTAQILEMKSRRANGEMLKDIAKEYNIHPAHLGRIISGQRWAHLNQKGLI